MKRRAAGGEEQDAFSEWRKLLNWKPGEIKKLKRKANKRERQQAKKEIKGDE